MAPLPFIGAGTPAASLTKRMRLSDRPLLDLIPFRRSDADSATRARQSDPESGRLSGAASLIASIAWPRSETPEPSSSHEARDSSRASDLCILPRQNGAISTIPSTYGGNTGYDPGTIVGITLGSVGGFIFLLYLLYACINLGNPDVAESIGTASVVTRKSRRHRHHHRSPRRETVEIRTRARGPIVVEEAVRVPAEGVERIVVEERVRSVSRGGPPPPRVVREEDDSEDEVIVLEERTPPRRKRSPPRRSSRDYRRETATYREVDTERYVSGGAGGYREVRRSSSNRRG